MAVLQQEHFLMEKRKLVSQMLKISYSNFYDKQTTTFMLNVPILHRKFCDGILRDMVQQDEPLSFLLEWGNSIGNDLNDINISEKK